MSVVLDGAMGTALAGRDAPERVIAIHRDAVLAGAQVITTHTFGIEPDGLGRAVDGVAWARAGIAAAALDDGERIRVAGSIGALGRRWSGNARQAYGAIARALVQAGADVVFVETLIDVDDAHAAAEGIVEQVPLWISIACGPDGRPLGRGSLGELVTDEVAGIVIGCTEHGGLGPALDRLAEGPAWRGVQPSTGATVDGRFVPARVPERAVAETVLELARARSLALVGGCCGTTAHYVEAIADGVHPRAGDRAAAFDALDAHLREAAA